MTLPASPNDRRSKRFGGARFWHPRPAHISIWLVMGCLLLASCQTPAIGAQRQSVTLTVSAAADLTLAFQEIGKAYEQQTGNHVVFNFGSTGQLAQQIDQGAPVDVFAAANVSYVEDLEKKGLIVAGTKKLYAQGRITVWTRADSPQRLTRLQDLLDPQIKHIAIANPEHAPYGTAAKEAMQSQGIWDKVQDKLVFGENATQTLQYAQTGNVEVAIAPLSLSTQGDGQWTLIPGELHNPINQALAVIKGTQHEAEARTFADFINGPEGRPVMRKYGFILPGEEPNK
jgi:molybdate transport system substrate-binding protein